METLTEPAVEEREERAAEDERPAPPPLLPAGPPAEPRVEASTEPRVEPRGRPERRRRRKFRTLPWKTRLILATGGTLLLILGVAGLFLPFLQGILFLVLAAAVLSLASERVYGWLRDIAAERWPGFWRRVERFRTRVLWKFRR